ncbi:hypothetical protein GCM10011574_45450 [Microbispora bryophytorum]|uniref:Uncharacterized protein n=1 Tax=Microbispora bryophytorum TaxID=1460882 RepID=A0A8H9LCJ6_9ACTN|nr:hypothetical protein GCM10011574_45450 [Microbispora bryophytorum]
MGCCQKGEKPGAQNQARARNAAPAGVAHTCRGAGPSASISAATAKPFDAPMETPKGQAITERCSSGQRP